MTSIAVVGLGNFGSALAHNWLQHGFQVYGWTVEQEVYDSIANDGVNAKYLNGVKLPGLIVSMDMAEVVGKADVAVLALPSSIVLDVVGDLLVHLGEQQTILDVAKGLGPEDQLLSEAITGLVHNAGLTNPVAIMVGPTIAPEVAAGVLTTALVAAEDQAVADRLAHDLATPTLRLKAGTDPIGAELWGAFKNVIAIVCGISDGLPTGGGDNLKAAIVAAGFREGCRLMPQLGADPETALGPAGIGDLYVTATSPHGRNRSLGERLGSGMTLEAALGATVMVSEGVRAARMFLPMARSKGIDTPFVSCVNELLDGKLAVGDCVRKLIEL